MKQHFPLLNRHPDFVYLDTAATALKPWPLTEALKKFYDEDYATVNRAVYTRSLKASYAFRQTKELLAQFLHVSSDTLIWTRGTTESINLLAYLLEPFIQEGEAVLITEAEHHANLIPWQLLAERKKIVIKVILVKEDGEIDLDAFSLLLTPDVKIVSIPFISNVLGVINPVKAIGEKVQANGSIFIVDGAQAPFHTPLDLTELGVDFFAASIHKMYGPTGLGFLYGKEKWLKMLRPFHGGGDMIESVTFQSATFQNPPLKFEAGTPNIADVIAYGSVLQFLLSLDLSAIYAHERALVDRFFSELGRFDRIQLLGSSKERIGIFSFTVEGMHALDLSLYLDTQEIAVRSGHLCAIPLIHRFNRSEVVRVSFGMYTTQRDLDRFFTALDQAQKIF